MVPELDLARLQRWVDQRESTHTRSSVRGRPDGPGRAARARRVRDVRRALFEVGPDEVRSDGDFLRVSVPQRDCDVLRDLIAAERAQVVVEIGLAYGASALAIGEALIAEHGTAAVHLVVDAYQHNFFETGRNALTRAGLAEVCTVLRDRSQVALAHLVGAGFTADAAFVDGSHVFHNVFVDLAFLRDLVRPGGLVILDDCGWPSVATAARYFEVNTGWRPEPTAAMSRLRAYRLPDPPVEATFEHFTAF